MSDSEIRKVKVEDLRMGPIRHESLPTELLEHIGMVYELIGPYLETTLEEFEIGFMRDMHPEREVAIWCRIAAAWVKFHKLHTDDQLLDDEQEGKLVGSLIAVSSGLNAADLPVPADVAKKLVECYAEPE